MSFTERALKVLKYNRLTAIGAGIVLLVILAGILAPLIAPYDPNVIDVPHRLGAPELKHLFGTDEMGRDIFTRVLYGCRISVSVGIAIVCVSAFFGILFGSISGYAGGKVDNVIMSVSDMVLSFPSMVLALALTASLGLGLFNTMLAVSIVKIPVYVRLVRGQVLSLKQRQYVKAARTFGAPPFLIIWKHIIPNSLTPIMVQMTLGLGDAILMAASMSFIGLGAQPPTPEWGAMVNSARAYAIDQWWYAAFPGLSILVTVVGFNLLGDGIRDILDPKSKQG